MPRARQMPRTRRLRRLDVANYTCALILITVAGAVVRGTAGAQWWWGIAGLVVFLVLVVAGATWIHKRLRARQPAAYAADLAALSPEERALPYGVVAGSDGELLLPSKVSVAVIVWVLAVGLVAGGVAALLVDDSAARFAGAVLVLVGAWTGLLAYWVTGTRIRITPQGVETRMGPRRFSAWIDVPEIKTDRQIVILKAAGARRPRVWIRVGVLEVGVADCVAMIRRQRGW